MKYPVREPDLAKAAGLARSDLKKTRDARLVEGKDWCLQKNAVCLTERAALALLTAWDVASPALLLEGLLGASEDEKTPLEKSAPESNPSAPLPALLLGFKKSAPPAPERITATVKKLPLNTRFLAATLSDGKTVLVRVRNNRMFAVKQVIPVAQTASAVWMLDAPHPRKRGLVPGFKDGGRG